MEGTLFPLKNQEGGLVGRLHHPTSSTLVALAIIFADRVYGSGHSVAVICVSHIIMLVSGYHDNTLTGSIFHT